MLIRRLIYLVLIVPVNTYSQTCQGQAKFHLITEYGTFTPGLSDTATINKNNTTINNAIKQLGMAGGGIIGIPAGTFYIGPDPKKTDRAVTINYNNITICGAGMYLTILRTNAAYVLVNGAVRRGHGIIIQGTSGSSNPRKNIVLKDFELDGQAGWTGDYGWPANPANGNGWDISHKGIVPSWDNNVDSVKLENLYVHHYRGEILYVGGMSLGRLHVKNVRAENTNGSDFNLYAADLLVENSEFGGPSRFCMELTARQNQGNYSKNQSVFKHNYFHNAVGATAIAITQGDFKAYTFVFDSNKVAHCSSGAWGVYGGIGGPVNITHNTISSVSGSVLEFGEAPGWINNNASANVTFEKNTIDSSGMMVSFYATQENITIRDNSFKGKSATNLGQSTSVFYGASTLKNSNVENNTFTNCRTPEQTAVVYDVRPYFQNNNYLNVERRDVQGRFTINASSLKVTPHFEEIIINTDIANAVVAFETNNYPDNQPLKVNGGSTAKPVRFAMGQPSYYVSQDRYLNGSNTLYFHFDKAQNKWIEDVSTSIDKSSVLVENMIVSPNPVNQLTVIRYQLSENCRVNISIYDVLGKKMMQLLNENQSRGVHQVIINAEQLPHGVYFVRMNVNEEQITKKLVVNKY